MEKKTELGTEKTPKGGYQSKRKEILFLLIDSYRQLINIKVCQIKMHRSEIIKIRLLYE